LAKSAVATLTPKKFQQCVLAWFARHGRKNLPWQQNKSPYSIWLSEIMLQQTQVVTVIPYFKHFIERFPTLSSLAHTELDEVLSFWSGLGYYARGRHLHRCAQIIAKEYAGSFPQDLKQLQKLPGIGRSTAGAILSLGFNQPAPILDGNVKRVLTRLHGISGWPGSSAIKQKLWFLAEYYTPKQQNAASYTQAMMDLGALICTRKQAKCDQCPLKTYCLAYTTANPEHFPSPKPAKKLPVRHLQMLLLLNKQQEILLEKRPPTGIWGGLWSLPECSWDENPKLFCKKYYYCETEKSYPQTRIRHTFSHFHLEIQPILLWVKKWQPPLMDSNRIVWYNVEKLHAKGLAAPVKKLIKQLHETLV
jgi:A/G-specific adenine glycosylase